MSLPIFFLLLCLTCSLDLWADPAADARKAAEAAAKEKALEPDTRIKQIRLAPGLKIDHYATEPLLLNPVAFSFDEAGRLYVVETHRRRTSVYDIRNHRDWLDADFSFRTVLDRSNFLNQALAPGKTNLARFQADHNGDGTIDILDLQVESEAIRLLIDTNRDGRADSSTIFATNFNTSVSGVAAGVLARKSDLWFACIPDLWLLRDTNFDGRVDVRTNLLSGFGVHISFGGHDLHGLRFGPDGKIYFSIADRGLHVEQGGRTVSYPDSGAVMRCNRDGTEFELYATGLRNPQELAFDDYGNLFTGDNNGDGGDAARWVYLVEGGESGWHIGWQHLPKMGPWNSEKLWHLAPTNTAAYILPPVAHIGHGPAGIVYHPGTGLNGMLHGKFFMCDFPGGVRSIGLKPRGAGFELAELRELLWNIYPVDVDFGPDGALYILDWVDGWEKPGKGRVYRITPDNGLVDPVTESTRTILATGVANRPLNEFAKLLGHPDQRVRQEAQFTFAEIGLLSTNLLLDIVRSGQNEMARIHAIWAMGQMARTNPLVAPFLLPFVADPNPEIRAQIFKVLGDVRANAVFDAAVAALVDQAPRVRFFALMALGKLGNPAALDGILRAIEENADRDPYLRHAAVMALVGLNDPSLVEQISRDESRSVRLAALLAMRKLARPEIVSFLHDEDGGIVLEAARAIHDLPITQGISQLAALITRTNLSEPVIKRAINANFRLGKLEHALALSDYAINPLNPESLRIEAIQRLGQWVKPPGRDPVIGLWRPLPEREARTPRLALSEIDTLLAGPPGIQLAAIESVVTLGLDHLSGFIYSLLTNDQNQVNVRVAALKALLAWKSPQLSRAMQAAAESSHPELRKEAALFNSQSKPANAALELMNALEKGTLSEKQAAIVALGEMKGVATDPILLMLLDRLLNEKLDKGLELELLEAAAKRNDPAIIKQLARFEKSRGDQPLAQYRESLFGGNAEEGKKIFVERTDLACLRCHKMNGEGGDLGPDLTGLGKKQGREHLLESILFPNAKMAPGFENLLITLNDGASHAGILKSETDSELLLNSPEDGLVTIQKSQIKSRQPGLSAMPAEMGTALSRRELRNLVEYLAQ
ncbi:MAG: HEAT repeat domain-containing protein [Verrucomicrobiota bacterium]|nr:HEAT repeat domain-containing protein [Verrucomicrobiota bacterium]